MTVPVARASARRTVRVAAGLVAGQAVLCAVIGYVTLGSHGSGGRTAGGVVDPLAAHPLTMPPPRVPLTSPTILAPERAATTTSTSVPQPAGIRPQPLTDAKPTPLPTPTPAAEPPADILVAPGPPSTGPATVSASTTAPSATSTAPSTGSTPPSLPPSQPPSLPPPPPTSNPSPLVTPATPTTG